TAKQGGTGRSKPRGGPRLRAQFRAAFRASVRVLGRAAFDRGRPSLAHRAGCVTRQARRSGRQDGGGLYPAGRARPAAQARAGGVGKAREGGSHSGEAPPSPTAGFVARAAKSALLIFRSSLRTAFRSSGGRPIAAAICLGTGCAQAHSALPFSVSVRRTR